MKPVRRAVALALPAVVVLSLTACSGGSEEPDTAPPTIDSSSASPSPSAPSTTSAPTRLDDRGHDVIPGKVVASGDEQRAVVAAWMSYWRFRQATYARAKVDASQLGSVATGKAADQVISYASDLATRKHHVVGDLRVGADRIKLTGAKATLRSCIDNRSTERKADDSPAESLTPFYVVDGVLQKGTSGWRVTSVAIAGRAPC